MSIRPRHAAVHLRRLGARVLAEGDLAADNAGAFEEDLLALAGDGPGRLVVDLAGLDIEDGQGLLVAAQALGRLRGRVPHLALAHAPPALVQALRRAGLLEGEGAIELEAP